MVDPYSKPNPPQPRTNLQPIASKQQIIHLPTQSTASNQVQLLPSQATVIQLNNPLAGGESDQVMSLAPGEKLPPTAQVLPSLDMLTPNKLQCTFYLLRDGQIAYIPVSSTPNTTSTTSNTVTSVPASTTSLVAANNQGESDIQSYM